MRFSKLGIVPVLLFGFSATGMAQTAAGVPRADPPALVSEMTEEGWRLPFAHPDPKPWYLMKDGYTDDDALVAQKRLAAIIAEHSEGKSLPITPVYRAWWDTREARMWVAPNAGYVFVYLHNCAHGVQALSYGDVQISDGTLELLPKGGNSFSGKLNGEGFNPLAVLGTKMARVRLGGSESLVPEKKLEEFVASASGRKVRDDAIEVFSPFMHGAIRKEKPVLDGDRYPVLPPEYSGFFLAPIRGRVVSVGKPIFQPEHEEDVTNDDGTKERQTVGERFVVTVTCEVDLPDGLLPGMWLRLCQPGSWSALRVIKVSGHTVVGEFDPFPFEEPEGWDAKTVKEKLEWMANFQPFKRGLSVSTSAFDVPDEDESSPTKSDSK
jgi:hypothetical protein